MKREQYNGWTNYETWLLGLWLDNDEGSNDYWTQAAQEAYAAEAGNSDREEDAANELSKRLEAEIKEHIEEQTPSTGFVADLICAALGEIDWDEVAAHYMDNVEKEEPEAEEAEEAEEEQIEVQTKNGTIKI